VAFLSPLELTIIQPHVVLEQRSLGPDGPWQTTAAAGAYFAAHVIDRDGFALVGCSVAPGFEFADFHLATRAVLTAAYPQHAELIARYSRG
jgi:predicted cupin superfamily sugar epimerase